MDESKKQQVDDFILRSIDTVPQLEALLLLWRFRPRSWNAAAMAEALFVPPGAAAEILADLARQNLIAASSTDSEEYSYQPAPERDELIEAVDECYRHELIRISRMIHSKAPSAVREFAKAFRFRKEKD